MSPRTLHIFRQCIAAALSASVFAIDLRAGFDVSIAVLYALGLMIGAFGASPARIRTWMAIVGTLAVASFLLVHASDPDLGSVLRLLFALVAVAITGLLLISRNRIETMRATIEHSREELRIFADSVPQMLWATYPDGYCYFLSRQFTEFTGMPREVAIGEQNWTETIHPDDRPGFLAEMEAAYQKGTEFRAYFRIRNRDGGYCWMHWVAAPYRRPGSGKIHRWYGGCANVDSQFKAQETVRRLNHTLERRVEERTAELMRTEWRYRSLFQDRNIGVLELDFAVARKRLEQLRSEGVGNFQSYFAARPDQLEELLLATHAVEINETYRTMLGYDSDSAEDLLIHSPGENRLGGRAVLIRVLQAVFDRQDSISGTANIRTRQGAPIVIAYAINLSESGSAFCTVVDITARERAHELLLKAQNEMARASRAATVGALSVSLAHELNQPIASMSVDVETARRAIEQPAFDRDRMVRVIDRISRNTQRLAGIVQQTRSRVSGRVQTPAPLNLCELARETATLLERDASGRSASLHVRCDHKVPLVEADPVEIQQVLVNLIVNALDAMAELPAELSRVEIAVTRAGEDTVKVTVSDSGPGIPEETIDTIFQPFYTTKVDGVGMGLQICRWTVEALGGDLKVRNRPGGGAEFAFTLIAA